MAHSRMQWAARWRCWPRRWRAQLNDLAGRLPPERSFRRGLRRVCLRPRCFVPRTRSGERYGDRAAGLVAAWPVRVRGTAVWTSDSSTGPFGCTELWVVCSEATVWITQVGALEGS